MNYNLVNVNIFLMNFFCVCTIYDIQINKLFIMVINQILNRKIIVLRNA